METSEDKKSVMVFEGSEEFRHVPVVLLEGDEIIFSSIYTDLTGGKKSVRSGIKKQTWTKIEISQTKQDDDTVREG